MSFRPSFRTRALVYAALTANAIRPLPGFRVGVPSFFAGWITGEMAPHWLAVTTADAATHLTAKRRDPVALALAGATAVGLGYLIHLARRDQLTAEAALTEALGADYGEQLDALPTPAEVRTSWRSLVNPFRTFRKPPVPIRVERNIAFGEAGRRNYLDIYLPEEPVENAPVLLQVHGGAWILGKKEEQGIPLMQHLAAKGWVCVAINYRLSPRDPWPAQAVDVKKAIHWIRQHIAAYGGDPDYIAITGGSAGGHLTALTALTPNTPEWQPGFEDADTSVQLAIPHYGVYDLAGSTGHQGGHQAARPVPRRLGDEDDVARPPRGLRGRQPDPADHPGRPRLLRDPRRPRHPRPGRPGPPVRRPAARGLQAHGGLRRAARRPARLRHLPVDPVRAHRPRHRPLPALALEPVPPRAGRPRSEVAGGCQ